MGSGLALNRIGPAPRMRHVARPLRIEFADALYHITARGDRREPIYADEEDWERFLRLLGEVVEDSKWLCHAYCLMTNHYHLVIGTPEGNLSKGMRQLNGVYTQAYNRRHRQVGHLFQGRYKAILVEAERYLLELARYVVLNPVRAGMVSEPGGWAWSSYNATAGEAVAPPWLAVDALLAHFAAQRSVARRRYRRFVREGVGQGSIWNELNRQIYLGDDRFVERMQAQMGSTSNDVNIPKVQQRAPAASLGQIEAAEQGRAEAIVAAYATGAYSYQQIAAHFGVHFTTVGRYVRAAKRGEARPRVR
jgi:putative transposase